MWYPQISIFTGCQNNTTLIYQNICDLIRLPTYEVRQSNFHWKHSPHWEYGSLKDDFIYDSEGFDKIGYLRLNDSVNYIFVDFIPKRKGKNPPYFLAALLLIRFAVFLKKHIRGLPSEFHLSFR